MRTGDLRLTRIVCWKSFTDRSVTRRRLGMAALLIRTSTAPNAPSTSRAHSSAARRVVEVTDPDLGAGGVGLALLQDLEQAVLPPGDEGDPGAGLGQQRGQGGADARGAPVSRTDAPSSFTAASCRLCQYSAEPPRNSWRLVALPVAKSSK